MITASCSKVVYTHPYALMVIASGDLENNKNFHEANFDMIDGSWW